MRTGLSLGALGFTIEVKTQITVAKRFRCCALELHYNDEDMSKAADEIPTLNLLAEGKLPSNQGKMVLLRQQN